MIFHRLRRMLFHFLCVLVLALWGHGMLPASSLADSGTEAPGVPKKKGFMRVAAAQPKNRTIDFRLKPADVLAQVDRSLAELEQIVRKAGEAGCDALALPED